MICHFIQGTDRMGSYNSEPRTGHGEQLQGDAGWPACFTEFRRRQRIGGRGRRSGDTGRLGSCQRRNSQSSNESTALTRIMVVIGTYSLNEGRSTMMSPGSRPRGNFPSQGHANPMTTNVSPRTTSARCIRLRDSHRWGGEDARATRMPPHASPPYSATCASTVINSLTSGKKPFCKS